MPPRTSAQSVKPIAVVNPLFKMIFWVIAGAFFIALVTLMWLVIWLPTQ